MNTSVGKVLKKIILDYLTSKYSRIYESMQNGKIQGIQGEAKGYAWREREKYIFRPQVNIQTWSISITYKFIMHMHWVVFSAEER